jgi:hypothetical protein
MIFSAQLQIGRTRTKACARRIDDTEVGSDEVASVDPTEARKLS